MSAKSLNYNQSVTVDRMSSPIPLPPLRNGHRAGPELIARREAVGSRYTMHPGVTIAEDRYGGVRCLVCTHADARLALLYLHGGGFRLGSPEASIRFASHLSKRAGVSIVIPEYRLAPEHPFPAALHDIDAVLEALLTNGQRIILCGDSAGGNLAATAVVRWNCAANQLAGLVLISGWLDLTLVNPTFASNAKSDVLFSHAQAQDAVHQYLQGHPPTDPLASPLLGPFIKLPPTCIVAGSAEVLLDDSLNFAAKFAHAGMALELHCLPDMQHVAVTLDPTWPGALRAFEKISHFLTDLL